jgi:hypothetical protein
MDIAEGAYKSLNSKTWAAQMGNAINLQRAESNDNGGATGIQPWHMHAEATKLSPSMRARG